MLFVVLAGVALIAGVGITAVGPGGVLSTVGLAVLTDLDPAGIAGTVMVTNLATGVIGTAAYWHSGHLRARETARIAVVMVITAVIGTPAGVLVNTLLTPAVFADLLAGFVVVVAGLVWYRQRRGEAADRPVRHRFGMLAGVGLAVSVASGMFGVGGPLLSVPVLVALRTPVLPALAAAQVQSVVISLVGAAGYVAIGSVDWLLALVIGVPQLVGAVIGWRVARAVHPVALHRALIAVLLATAPLLVIAA